jgi:hypothetical protein
MTDISVVESWLEAANLPSIMDFSPATPDMAFVMFARPLTEAELSRLRGLNLDVWDLGGLCSYRVQFVPSVEDED